MSPQCNPIEVCIQPESDKRLRIKYKVIIIFNKPSILNLLKKKEKEKKERNFINGNTLNDSFHSQTH